MGTVDIDFSGRVRLEDFMRLWENYFFTSYFSHYVGGYNPTGQNLSDLWKKQVTEGTPFPNEILLPAGITLKSLLS